jgi:hypothetical protein
MEIENELIRGNIFSKNSAKNSAQGNQTALSFSDVIDAEVIKGENLKARDEIIANQMPGDKNPNKEDIDYIRENGLQAYADKVKAEKIEKMRAELLESMGLTEKLLAAMPPEQRMAIEDIIDDTIEQRMAASSIMNSKPPEEPSHNNNAQSGWSGPIGALNHTRIEIVNPAQDFGIGSSMIELIEQSQAARREDLDETNG